MLRTSLESFVKKLRRLSTPAELIRRFVETCVVPLILYCSPGIFPGLLKHDFALLKRSIKSISQVSGLSFSYLTNLLALNQCYHCINTAALSIRSRVHTTYSRSCNQLSGCFHYKALFQFGKLVAVLPQSCTFLRILVVVVACHRFILSRVLQITRRIRLYLMSPIQAFFNSILYAGVFNPIHFC